MLEYDVISPPSTSLRPIIGLKVPGDRWIYCVHAPSSGGAAGVAGKMLQSIPSTKSNWACFGDYNCEPAKITCPAGAQTVGGTSSTHQGGGKLDYAVTRNIVLALDTTGKRLGPVVT